MANAFKSVESIHGEFVDILSGTDAGKTFTAVILTQPSMVLGGDIGEDVREKVMAHFANTRCPRLERGNQMRDSSGNVWKIVGRTDNPADSTTDFELVKIASGKDL